MRAVLFGLIVSVTVFVGGCAETPVANVKKIQTDADIPRVSAADAKKEVDAGDAIIVDSRQTDAYAQERIAGSVNIPFGTSNDAFSKLPSGKKIIVYCS